MVEKIGETAGRIWEFLHRRGGANLNQIKKNVKADPTLILQAIGWLAREDKLVIEKKDRFTIYALKN